MTQRSTLINLEEDQDIASELGCIESYIRGMKTN